MEWMPRVRFEAVTLAWPPLRLWGVPSWVVPSTTAPWAVRAPSPGGVAETVAVNVTGPPRADGLFPEEFTSTVPVLALLTVWVMFGAVLPAKFGSPLYVALMTCG